MSRAYPGSIHSAAVFRGRNMATVGSTLRQIQQDAFEPLFPKAQPAALPRPVQSLALKELQVVDDVAPRERAAREEGRAAGFREGLAQGARAARAAMSARLDAALAEMEGAVSELGAAYRARLDVQAAESERVILALAERLAAPGARAAIEALFRRYVLDALEAGARTGGRLVLSAETLEILQGDRPDFGNVLEARGVEIVSRADASALRCDYETGTGAAIVVDFDALLAALKAVPGRDVVVRGQE